MLNKSLTRFRRIQNLHISQTLADWRKAMKEFRRIQNLHISQTYQVVFLAMLLFRRIQNLHISQTSIFINFSLKGFVEFKIYISLKLFHCGTSHQVSFVEFKIYISLKHISNGC